MGQLCPVHSVTTGRYPPPELQRLLCGTELEGANECTVPIPAGQISLNRPVSQIRFLRIWILRSSRWRPHPTGQELPVEARHATGNNAATPVIHRTVGTLR